MLKKFFVVFAILLAVVLVLCGIYLPSFSRYHELKQEEEKLTKRIQEIDAQIKTLADEKYLLQNDVAYLEKVIREELGFVKPGEVIYEMVTKKGAGETATPAGNVLSGTGSEATSNATVSSTTVKKSVPAPSVKTTSKKTRTR